MANVIFLLNPYFTTYAPLEPLTSGDISYVEVFGLCPSPRTTGGD
jgi:hypothetical protein